MNAWPPVAATTLIVPAKIVPGPHVTEAPAISSGEVDELAAPLASKKRLSVAVDGFCRKYPRRLGTGAGEDGAFCAAPPDAIVEEQDFQVIGFGSGCTSAWARRYPIEQRTTHIRIAQRTTCHDGR